MESAKAALSVPEQFERKVEQLWEDSHPEQLIEALKLLLRLFENIANNPLEVKYRSINKKNKTLQEKLFKISGVEQLVTLAGFQYDAESDTYALKSDADVYRIYPILTPLRDQTNLNQARLESDEAYEKQVQLIAERKKFEAAEKQRKAQEDQLKNLMACDKKEAKYIKAKDSNATTTKFGAKVITGEQLGFCSKKGG
jgi:hypothetical protein